MSHNQGNPSSRREVWLQIALAVAKKGLPEPKDLNFPPQIVSLDFDRWDHATRWAKWLDTPGPDDEDRPQATGIGALDTEKWQDHAPTQERAVYYHGERYGLHWTISGFEPDPGPEVVEDLAARVVAAIFTPDAEVSS